MDKKHENKKPTIFGIDPEVVLSITISSLKKNEYKIKFLLSLKELKIILTIYF
jgi:hypothetical protein